MPTGKGRQSPPLLPSPGFTKKPKRHPDPILELAFDRCGDLLDWLMRHEYGPVFNSPVDVRGLGFLDYYTYVSEPMDLGTVRKRIAKRQYASPRDFAADVRLTFHNAVVYDNRPGTDDGGGDVTVLAETLLQIFDLRWSAIEASLPPEAPPLPPPPLPVSVQAGSAAVRLEDVKRLRGEVLGTGGCSDVTVLAEKLMQIFELRWPAIEASLRTVASPFLLPPPSPPVQEGSSVVSLEEMKRLRDDVQRLPREMHEGVVEIISKRRCRCLGDMDGQLQLDFSYMDAGTFTEIEQFVSKYKHQGKCSVASFRVRT